tara:strand:- start:1282 stop:2037 length:756 start_codon:yes stop_codon:yes gene_type:complete
MLKTRVIPLIQISGNSAVKTINFKNYRVVGDVVSTIKIFSKRMADEMIIVDIEASKTKKINFKFLKKLSKECIMPLSLGGGICSLDDISKMFDSGADKVVVNSLFHDNIKLLDKAVKKFGSQAVILSIDLYEENGKLKMFSNSKNKKEKLFCFEKSLTEITNTGVGEVLLNCVDNDGVMRGYNNKLIKEISTKINIPIIAAGGCGKSEDCVEAIHSGAKAVAAGSLFYWVGESIISLKNTMKQSGINVRLI